MKTGLKPPCDSRMRLHHGVRDVGVRVRPGVDDLVVALTVRDVAGRVGALEALHALLGLIAAASPSRPGCQVLDADRDAAARGVAEAEVLEAVEERDRAPTARLAVATRRRARRAPSSSCPVLERQLRRDDRVEQHAARRGHDPACRRLGARMTSGSRVCCVRRLHRQRHLELRHCRGRPTACTAPSAGPSASASKPVGCLRREVAAEHDVLRRLRHRTAVRRLEDVVRRQHEHARLELRLERERHVHGHLVTVEVGVERRADERMDADGLALDQHRLERLDAQAVERRRAVRAAPDGPG